MERPEALPPVRAIHAALRCAAVCVLPAVPALAAPVLRPTPDCAAAQDGPLVTVATVSEQGDVALSDGRTIRLAGIDIARGGAKALDRSARAALLAWAEGPVQLRPLGAPDRWGRIPALLFRATPPGEAGAALLAAGLARVAPEASVHACAAGRLAAEDGARAAGRGLWSDPGAAVLAPSDAAGLAAQAGGLAIVQGVLRLHESRGALYLALGRDRHGFTAVVSRRDAKLFDKAGLNLRDYAGTPVRLRGDLDARFGPRMRVTDPDAVESLEPGSIADGG